MTRQEKEEQQFLLILVAVGAVIVLLYVMRRVLYALPWQALMQAGGTYETGYGPRDVYQKAGPGLPQATWTDHPPSGDASGVGGLAPQNPHVSEFAYDENPSNRGTPGNLYASSMRGQVIPSNPLSIAQEALQVLQQSYQTGNGLYSEGKY